VSATNEIHGLAFKSELGAKPGTTSQNKAKRTNQIDFLSRPCKQGVAGSNPITSIKSFSEIVRLQPISAPLKNTLVLCSRDLSAFTVRPFPYKEFSRVWSNFPLNSRIETASVFLQPLEPRRVSFLAKLFGKGFALLTSGEHISPEGGSMKKRRSYLKSRLGLTALTTFFGFGMSASAQSQPVQNDRPVQANDTTRQELARFDQFLDDHPNIAE
jgi:hypothetical protein